MKSKRHAIWRVFAAAGAMAFILSAAGGAQAGQEKAGDSQTGAYLFLTPFISLPFTVDTTSPLLSPGKTEAGTGGGLGAGLGYRYGDWRCEAEIMYGRSGTDRVRFAGGGGALSGYYDMRVATLNLFYDVPTGWRLTPYLGAGLGGALFEAHGVTLGGFSPTEGRSTVFAYKLMAGVSCRLSATWTLLAGYRFLGLGSQEYVTGGISLHGEPIEIHALQAGLLYHF